MFVVQDPRTGVRYGYDCIRCGACCRHAYEIVIRTSDVERWMHRGREDIARGLQVDLKSVAPAALIPLSWYSAHDASREADPAGPERAFVASHQAAFDGLASFLLECHENAGTGGTATGPLVPFWFLPGVDFRTILRPKNLGIVKRGIELGIQYVMIMAIKDACAFLEGDACSIHEVKPADCAEYPVKEQLEREPRAMEKFLAVCKGIREAG
ncbi:MAG: YkgJ family cysteine cluster protein [Candidatus Lokiarchaeota archaeon]|nr:YkgJ family cysteine cluster protein [Candidatus Lokiarchaeota archaeon]